MESLMAPVHAKALGRHSPAHTSDVKLREFSPRFAIVSLLFVTIVPLMKKSLVGLP
jgi:hypothetical protein